MKFDVVVGNPPYQENDNGKREDGSVNASASPLYHLFFDLSKKISTDKINLIFPAKWLSGAGKGLNNFTESMLNDKHIQSLTIFKDSSTVFPGTDIKGGVLFMTYNQFYNGKSDITVIDHQGSTSIFKSYLNSADSGLFIPYGELLGIYEKVSLIENLSLNNIQKITSSRKPYGLSTDFLKKPDKYGLPDISHIRKHQDDIEVIGLDKSKKRVSKYISKDYPLPSGQNTIYKWKLFTLKAMGGGVFGESLPSIPIGAPGQVATETFIRMGCFDTEYEAKSLQKYMYSKFFRAMLGIIKNTQDAPSRVYKFIPMQNFTSKSDIDWDVDLKDIDQQLFDKYGLNQEEREFIKSKVKEMHID